MLVLDTDDPSGLAMFYRDLLGWTVDELEEEWACLVGPGGAELGFQISIGYRPPTYPAPDVPQQMHVDFYVDDLDGAIARAQALGAGSAGVRRGLNFITLLDPSGHPFCLCRSPELRDPVTGPAGEGDPTVSP